MVFSGMNNIRGIIKKNKSITAVAIAIILVFITIVASLIIHFYVLEEMEKMKIKEDKYGYQTVYIESRGKGYIMVRNLGTKPVIIDSVFLFDPETNQLLYYYKLEKPIHIYPNQVRKIDLPDAKEVGVSENKLVKVFLGYEKGFIAFDYTFLSRYFHHILYSNKAVMNGTARNIVEGAFTVYKHTSNQYIGIIKPWYQIGINSYHKDIIFLYDNNQNKVLWYKIIDENNFGGHVHSFTIGKDKNGFYIDGWGDYIIKLGYDGSSLWGIKGDASYDYVPLNCLRYYSSGNYTFFVYQAIESSEYHVGLAKVFSNNGTVIWSYSYKFYTSPQPTFQKDRNYGVALFDFNNTHVLVIFRVMPNPLLVSKYINFFMVLINKTDGNPTSLRTIAIPVDNPRMALHDYFYNNKTDEFVTVFSFMNTTSSTEYYHRILLVLKNGTNPTVKLYYYDDSVYKINSVNKPTYSTVLKDNYIYMILGAYYRNRTVLLDPFSYKQLKSGIEYTTGTPLSLNYIQVNDILPTKDSVLLPAVIGYDRPVLFITDYMYNGSINIYENDTGYNYTLLVNSYKDDVVIPVELPYINLTVTSIVKYPHVFTLLTNSELQQLFDTATTFDLELITVKKE